MNSTIVEEMSNTPESYNNYDSVLETVTENKNYTTFSPDARQNKKKKSNGKCMSIRDIILDRQLNRLRDNNKQKEGYVILLEHIAKRRRENVEYDVQQEEIKLLNGIKMHVESGWVVDRPTLAQLFKYSGITAIQEEYERELGNKDQEFNPDFIPIIQFAQKVASNMGLPDFVPLKEISQPERMPGEMVWAIDEKLYLNDDHK